MECKPTQYCYRLLRALAVTLLVVHGVLTWQLVGGTLTPLLNEHPLLEGAHAAQFYHGLQVATAVRERGLSAVVYDPSYQAGYPMPPWTTIESRLAVLACWLAPEAPQTTYKLAVIFCWLMLPVIMWLMCRVCNSGSGAICAALLLLVSSAWSPWGIQLLRSGEMDVLLGTASLGLALSAMVRSYARPRWWTMPLGLGATATALYFWPITMGLLFICFLLFLTMLAGRLPWGRFLGLLLAMLGGIALNSVWLREAWQTWWMLGESEALAVAQMSDSLNIKANLQLLIWPGILLVVGFLSTTTLRPGIGGRSALVWSCAIVLASLAALVPLEIDSLHLGKSNGWWWCSMWLAALPIGKFAAMLLELVSRRLVGGRGRTALLLTLLLAGLGIGFQDQVREISHEIIPHSPLAIGTSADLLASVEQLHRQTTPAGRILWEEIPETSAWSPLLSWLAERPLVGGLGRAEPVNIETLQVRLVQGTMLGRSLELWPDDDLKALAETFNLGWVAAFHPTTQQRFKHWASAEFAGDLPLGGKLYRINRPLSYCRQGQAEVLQADPHRITLINLIPEDGQIILSFHAHAQMHLTNAWASLETWQHPYDGVPMIRLRLPGPMARLTIEW